MSDRAAFDEFTAKWRARWPEWGIAEAFVPAGQRDAAVAWFALLQEFADAAWGGEDPAPGLAKLAWWQEELRGWTKGARRHPLGLALQAQAVDWRGFAEGMGALRHREVADGPIATSLSQLRPFADAVAVAERALFGTPAPEADAVSCVLLAPWRRGVDATRLLARWPVRTVGARPRRMLAALARARLEQATQEQVANEQAAPPSVSRWRTLWRAWRAARN